jgi:ribonuclease HII
MLQTKHNPSNTYEIGVDECARGPLFGRLYTAAAVLPEQFDHHLMKDSKKIKSRKKMQDLSDYIKENAVAYSVDFIEADEIDKINIRQAVLKSMRQSIINVIDKLDSADVFAVVDGNDFLPFTHKDRMIPFTTVKQGDNTYTFIAAASILAKCAHDKYIAELCEAEPDLHEKYDLLNNVGYGTKKHLEGIEKHGISQYHRKSYSRCKI